MTFLLPRRAIRVIARLVNTGGCLGALLVAWTVRASSPPNESMVSLPAARVWIGDDRGDADERPRRLVSLGAFAIDRYEVTQAHYAQCVAAQVCRPMRNVAHRQGPNLPAVGLTWLDAQRFCAWRGARLPTEVEWERAARGTQDQRVFPWGDAVDCAKANFGSFDGDGPCAQQHPGHVVEVGRFAQGRSPDGLWDMAGNVWEWVADEYQPTIGNEMRGTSSMAHESDLRVLRGGSCCSYFTPPRISNRHRLAASYAGDDVGFRCAKDLP